MKLSYLLTGTGIIVLGTVLFPDSSKAESAIRAAYVEVRPNGSSVSVSFEHVLPDGVFFDNSASGSTTLTITVDDPGLNTSSIRELSVNAITNAGSLETVEAATARSIDSATALGQFEDVIGIVRSFVGVDDAESEDISLD